MDRTMYKIFAGVSPLLVKPHIFTVVCVFLPLWHLPIIKKKMYLIQFAGFLNPDTKLNILK